MRIGPEPMMRTFIDLAPRGRGLGGRGPRTRSGARRDRSSRQSRSSRASGYSYVQPSAAARAAAAPASHTGDRRAASINFDVENARPADLEALLDTDPRGWRDLHQIVDHEVRAERTLGRSGRGVLVDTHAVGEHASVHVGPGSLGAHGEDVDVRVERAQAASS